MQCVAPDLALVVLIRALPSSGMRAWPPISTHLQVADTLPASHIFITRMTTTRSGIAPQPFPFSSVFIMYVMPPSHDVVAVIRAAATAETAMEFQ